MSSKISPEEYPTSQLDVGSVYASPNGHGNGALLDFFQRTVDVSPFYEVAETALRQVQDPEALVQFAELAGNREPGGGYYRARFWHRMWGLLAASSAEPAQKAALNRLCQKVGVTPTIVRNYIRQGEAIVLAEEATSTSLRRIPPITLHYAVRQKDRAAEYLIEAVQILGRKPGTTPTQIHNQWCARNGGTKANLDIIKPSDWWAFSHPKWRQEEDFPGSIPGEVYANALYYFAPRQGIAVDPMAGSGMLKRVYDDRERWQKDSAFALEIHLFDLYPRRPFIKQRDVSEPLPFKAHWIFLDPPYFGQSGHLYYGELASITDYEQYLSRMQNIVEAMAFSLYPEGRLCIFLPKWSGLRSDDPNYDLPGDVGQLTVRAGLHWIDTAFVSRGRQQEPGSAMKNIAAKRNQRMRSDTCVLNVFEKVEY